MAGTLSSKSYISAFQLELLYFFNLSPKAWAE